jgi:stage IV sporulation protein FB
MLGQIGQAVMAFSLVIAHEGAHIVAAKAQGVRVTALEISPIGGSVQCEDTFEGQRWLESSIAAAGPALNILFLLGAEILRWQGGIGAGDVWLEDFIRLNFWLAGFNLIPVLPLDGGRIARALSCAAFGFVRVTKGFAGAGCALGIGLGLLALFSWWSQAPAGEFILLSVLGLFFWLSGKREIFQARIIFLRQLTRKKEELNRKGLMAAHWLTVRPDTPLVRIVETFTPDRYAFVALEQPRFDRDQIFTETEILDGLFRQGISGTIGRLRC